MIGAYPAAFPGFPALQGWSPALTPGFPAKGAAFPPMSAGFPAGTEGFAAGLEGVPPETAGFPAKSEGFPRKPAGFAAGRPGNRIGVQVNRAEGFPWQVKLPSAEGGWPGGMAITERRWQRQHPTPTMVPRIDPTSLPCLGSAMTAMSKRGKFHASWHNRKAGSPTKESPDRQNGFASFS